MVLELEAPDEPVFSAVWPLWPTAVRTARTRLASSPVVFYAALFVCIDIAYNVFERDVLAPTGSIEVVAVAAATRLDASRCTPSSRRRSPSSLLLYL